MHVNWPTPGQLGSVILGASFGVFGFIALARAQWYLRHGKSAEGLIADFDFVWSRSRPVVRFTAHDGKDYSFRSGVAVSRPRLYRLRDEVGVLYDPRKPSRAVINSALTLRTLPLLAVVLGLALAIYGGIGWLQVGA